MQKSRPGKFHIRGGTIARGRLMEGRVPGVGGPQRKEPQQVDFPWLGSPDL